MSSQVRRETQPTGFLQRRLPRRAFFEAVGFYGGGAVAIIAGIEGVATSTAVSTEVDEAVPVFVNSRGQTSLDSTVNRLTEIPSRTQIQQTTLSEASRALQYQQTNKALRLEYATELRGEIDNTEILGIVKTGNLRHWAFWGGIASVVTATGSYIQRYWRD